ncbi:MAG TPA: DNA polymerase III subunit beta, partial [bacterium]|nr:DNA polymerase III subunit beta [bacterium]
MNLSINRDIFLPAVQSVIGAIERRQTLPILSNLLIQISGDEATITATDLEIELKTTINLGINYGNFEFTLPARKTADICKNFEEGSIIDFKLSNENLTLSSSRSRFNLSILPSIDYPKIDISTLKNSIEIEQRHLKKIINNVSFAMAQQDVRYYLNGVLFEINKNSICTVSTDGHRLALSEVKTNFEVQETQQFIIPRKT